MGSNVYLTHVKSYGYQTQTTGTDIIQDIPGRPRERIAIRAFGFTCAGTATEVVFMQALTKTTTTADAASGASQIAVTAAVGSMAATDVLVIVEDTGNYLFSICRSVATLTIDLCTNLTGAAASGATVYNMGVYSDDGHVNYLLTASVQTTEELDGGLIYADAKGYPMRVHHVNDAAADGKINYITVDYINK